MRKRFAVVSIAVSIAVVAVPSGASAATEIGNVCEANGGFPPKSTEIQLENASSALPIAVPSDGVLTSWKIKTESTETAQQQLVVFRPTGGTDEYRVAATSATEPVAEGTNVFPARIPVQSGERLGLFAPAPSPALFCEEGTPGDVTGLVFKELATTDAPTKFTNQAPNYRVPVSAVIEPDVDRDGFGDETQDKCPQSAQFQAECPQIGLEDFASVGKGAITMLVVADHEAPVTVTATTKGTKSPKRHSLKGGVLLKGGTQTVKPNQLAKFKLKFSPALKSQLRKLPHGKSLKLTVTAAATNLVGQVSTKTTTVSLKG